MLIALWILTGLLSLALLGAGAMKLLRPRSALVDGGMAWAADFSPLAIKAIAAAEVAAAFGLVLPLLTGILPMLSPITAVCAGVLMLGASVVHRRRRESALPPLVLTALSVTVAVVGFIVVASS